MAIVVVKLLLVCFPNCLELDFDLMNGIWFGCLGYNKFLALLLTPGSVDAPSMYAGN